VAREKEKEEEEDGGEGEAGRMAVEREWRESMCVRARERDR